MVFMKRKRFIYERSDSFDGLPDDLVISILCKLSATASSSSDFITIFLTSKRFNRLGKHPLVLSLAGPKTLAFPAKNWSDNAHRFLKLCVAAGNTEAFYFLGMIRFYCLKLRRSGESLMAKAAIRSHAPALYSLALIQFNGSGRLKDDRDLRGGVALCARAAFLGHIDARREIGHCLQDGYGVRKNVVKGRRLLVQANASELLVRDIIGPSLKFHIKNIQNMCLIFKGITCQSPDPPRLDSDSKFPGLGCELWNNFVLKLPVRNIHPVNKFLVDWFGLMGREPGDGLGDGLRMCSNWSCGRPETRKNEYRRCSGCGKVTYCSRGCQAHDWRLNHKVECAPMEEWMDNTIGDDMIYEVGDDPTVQVEDEGLVVT